MEKASDFGSIQVDRDSRINAFREKDGQTPWRIEGTDSFYASMGIYAFRTDILSKVLERPGNLFGRDLIPQLLSEYKVYAYDYNRQNHIPGIVLKEREGRLREEWKESGNDDCYWRDVGTISEYFGANMDLVSTSPRFNLYNREWSFFSTNSHLGPAKVISPQGTGQVESAIICEGSFLSDVTGRDLVISSSVYISNSKLEQVICFNSTLIADCRIQRTIIDKNVNIRGMEIGYDEKADRAQGIYVDPVSKIRVVRKNYQNG